MIKKPMFNFDFKVVKQYRHITSISEEDPIGSFFVYFLPLNHWGKKDHAPICGFIKIQPLSRLLTKMGNTHH